MEQGIAYVSRMSSMLGDLESSKKDMEKYRQQSHRGKPNGIELNVQILNNCWDIDKNKLEKLTVSPFIQSCMDDFNSFYINDRSNMYKLDFVFGLVIYIFLKSKFVRAQLFIKS